MKGRSVTAARLVGGALAALALTVSTLAPSVAAASPADVRGLDVLPDLDAAAARLAGFGELPVAEAPEAGSLADELTGVAALLDLPLDASEVETAVEDADLGAGTESALATLVAQLGGCTEDTREALGVTPHAELLSGAQDVRPAHLAGSRACAVALRGLAGTATPALEEGEAGAQPLTIWPLLSFSSDPQRDDVYVEDYLLSIDLGGEDTYLNNAGSNQIDLKRSVSSPVARYGGQPARGCLETYPDSLSGRVVEGPGGERVPSYDGPECVPVTALFLDLAGNDSYGQLEPPIFPDTTCSSEPSNRRMSTIGVGVEGVGMLIDVTVRPT